MLVDMRYDGKLIREQLAGPIKGTWNDFGESSDNPGQRILSFDDDHMDDVIAIITDYDNIALNDKKKALLAEIGKIRWEYTQSMIFDGVRTQADPAIAAITGAGFLGQFLPPGTVRKWKLADGHFRMWTQEEIIQFGAAIAIHIQQCFNREDELTELIVVATSLEDLSLINVKEGWPE